jgi:hypothetical protein
MLSKRFILYGFLSLTFAFNPTNYLAQNKDSIRSYSYSREVCVGVGVSTGSFVLAMKLRRSGGFLPELYNSDLVVLHHTPVMTFDFLQPIDRKASVGVAASYQSYRTAYDYYINGDKYRLDYGDVYTRINLGLRFLLYHTKNKKFHGYLAFRPGYTYWILTSNSPIPGYVERHWVRSSFSFQVGYGLRYFFLEKFGAGFEIGLGTAPYLAQFNIAYRL